MKYYLKKNSRFLFIAHTALAKQFVDALIELSPELSLEPRLVVDEFCSLVQSSSTLTAGGWYNLSRHIHELYRFSNQKNHSMTTQEYSLVFPRGYQIEKVILNAPPDVLCKNLNNYLRLNKLANKVIKIIGTYLINRPKTEYQVIMESAAEIDKKMASLDPGTYLPGAPAYHERLSLTKEREQLFNVSIKLDKDDFLRHFVNPYPNIRHPDLLSLQDMSAWIVTPEESLDELCRGNCYAIFKNENGKIKYLNRKKMFAGNLSNALIFETEKMAHKFAVSFRLQQFSIVEIKAEISAIIEDRDNDSAPLQSYIDRNALSNLLPTMTIPENTTTTKNSTPKNKI